MADPRERDALALLLADVLTAETVEPDLLLRYDREPAPLDDGERERVETYLAASPAHRDQLRVLTQFASSREQGGRGEGVVVPIDTHPRWRMRSVLVATALAASLALALLYATDAGFGPGDEPAAQVAEDTRTPGDVLVVPDPEAPGQQAAPDPATDTPESQIAGADTKRAAPMPATPQTGPEVEPLSPEPVRELADVPQPVPAPEIPEVQGVPEEIPTEEPLVIAMNFGGPLLYTPPSGSAPLAYMGGVRSPIFGLPTPQALAPSHFAWTLEESPTLYWFSSMPTEARVEFVLADPVSVDPALEFTLASPVPAGIHAVRLADHDVVLEPGLEYRWFVSVSPVEGDPSADLATRGGIQRIEAGAELEAKLEAAEPGERGMVYAESGLWYDALASVSEAIEHAPQEASLRELRAGLLEQVGLREAADYDRRAVQTTFEP